jgi:hypothetical protein
MYVQALTRTGMGSIIEKFQRSFKMQVRNAVLFCISFLMKDVFHHDLPRQARGKRKEKQTLA